MSITRLKPAYFLGTNINDPKVLGSKVDEIIIAVNDLTDGSTTQNTITPSSGTLAVVGAETISGALTVTGAVLGKASVTNVTSSSTTLTSAQSGTVFTLSRGAGNLFTLPAPSVGVYFDFIVLASGAHIINTDAGTTFIQGTLSFGIEATTPGANPGPKFFSGNGTSHTTITTDGSTKGGVLGSQIRLTCVSATVWQASGIMLASGTIATPFA